MKGIKIVTILQFHPCVNFSDLYRTSVLGVWPGLLRGALYPEGALCSSSWNSWKSYLWIFFLREEHPPGAPCRPASAPSPFLGRVLSHPPWPLVPGPTQPPQPAVWPLPLPVGPPHICEESQDLVWVPCANHRMGGPGCPEGLPWPDGVPWAGASTASNSRWKPWGTSGETLGEKEKLSLCLLKERCYISIFHWAPHITQWALDRALFVRWEFSRAHQGASGSLKSILSSENIVITYIHFAFVFI